MHFLPGPMPQPADLATRERIVHAHLRGVWRHLRTLGCPAFEADDLAQETFVVAFEKGLGDRNEHETAAFLRATARHLWLRSRSKQNRRAELLAAAAEDLWARLCRDDSGDRALLALRECVHGLGDRARRLVHLFYGEERSRTEVAAALGMQENGVKTALQRVRQALRECVQERLS